MKLIRLASNNNGVFTSNFGNDMVLEEKSKMALLNLTFKSDIGLLVLDDMKITTRTDITKMGTLNSRTISGEIFPQDRAGYTKFIQTLEFNLNATLELAIGKANEYNSSGSQYRIMTNTEGEKEILFRYCPFINPMAYTVPQTVDGDGRYDEIMSFGPEMSVVSTGSVVGPPPKIELLTVIEGASGIEDKVTNDNSMISAFPLAKGCGFMSARVADLIDNTSVLEDNGFAIGLTKVSLPSKNITGGDAIPIDDIFVELRINRPLEQYTYRIPDVETEKTSTIYPHRVAATPLVTGYLNLPLGNDWTQAPAAATERFDSLNLGPIATFRRTQVGSAIEHWWEATSATSWNVYFTGPPIPDQSVDTTVTADLTTGVLSFDTSATTFTPSGYGATPDTVTIPVNVNLHDVMGFEVTKGELKIVVYQNKTSPNNRNVIETIRLDPDTELYPYLYINGGESAGGVQHVKIDMFNWTADSLFYMESNDINSSNLSDGWGVSTDNELYTSTDATGMRNGLEVLQLDTSATDIETALPTPYWGSDNRGGDGRFGIDINMTLNMPNQVWRYLGFIKGYASDGDTAIAQTILSNIWTSYFSADGLPLLYDSDNFIVESTSLKLDSFDASKVEYTTNQQFTNSAELLGRRKNILMTIPVNDNNSGLVEYETNTPIFIDIGNAEKINVKNLNLRVLRKDFSPIKQGNELAIMTLLIDN
tara:strand:- start:235 stop:2352 length:2118 start_codon:yes stop_codon:yes gene_type:complete